MLRTFQSTQERKKKLYKRQNKHLHTHIWALRLVQAEWPSRTKCNVFYEHAYIRHANNHMPTMWGGVNIIWSFNATILLDNWSWQALLSMPCMGLLEACFTNISFNPEVCGRLLLMDFPNIAESSHAYPLPRHFVCSTSNLLVAEKTFLSRLAIFIRWGFWYLLRIFRQHFTWRGVFGNVVQPKQTLL